MAEVAPPVRLVVDADVSQAAGRAKPESRGAQCARMLEEIRKHRQFRLVFNTRLGDEWERNQSSFSSQWLASMLKFRRVEYVRLDTAELDAEIRTGAASVTVLDVLLKDAHLIGLALASDRRVLSMDAHARDHFARLSAHIEHIRAVMWLTPDQEFEGCMVWLEGGAPEVPGWSLHVRGQELEVRRN